MVPGDGSLTAEIIRDHVVAKVEQFGLCYKTDCINGTNDGCTTMIKYGELLAKLIQLCLAHGVQLSVVKTVYNLPAGQLAITNQPIQSNDDDDENEDTDDEEEDVDENSPDETGLVDEAPEILELQGKRCLWILII